MVAATLHGNEKGQYEMSVLRHRGCDLLKIVNRKGAGFYNPENGGIHQKSEEWKHINTKNVFQSYPQYNRKLNIFLKK